MAGEVDTNQLLQVLSQLLEETFESVHGYYIDRGTSLFETLAAMSAAQASLPVGGHGATVAAKVKHLAFSLEVSERILRSDALEPVDWGLIWRETAQVSNAEWAELQAELRQRYADIKALIAAAGTEPSPAVLQEALVTVVHAAYHLGEIRESLRILSDRTE